MYDIALIVQACLQAGTEVTVAWPVAVSGVYDWSPAGAVAITPGGGRAGSLLSGLLDTHVAGLTPSTGRVEELSMSDAEAQAIGLPPGVRARCLVTPASALPSELWDLLLAREPVCLVTRLDGNTVSGYELFAGKAADDAPPEVRSVLEDQRSSTAVSPDVVVTALWPTPRLVVAGGGPVAEALARAANLLGWSVDVIPDGPTVVALAGGLSRLDSLVVASHDLDVAGPVLAAGVDSPVGYLGALGSKQMKRRREDWLRARGVEDHRRIHSPAGLEIGASTPAEIAVAVLAEAISVTKSRSG